MVDAICTKWTQCWTNLHNTLHEARYCLDPEFHSYYHSASAKVLKDCFSMCDKVYGTGSAALSSIGGV